MTSAHCKDIHLRLKTPKLFYLTMRMNMQMGYITLDLVIVDKIHPSTNLLFIIELNQLFDLHGSLV